MFDWQKTPLRGLHFCSALALSIFLVLHLGNHATGLFGQQAHMEYMATARSFYRNPVVEPILLSLVGWQALSGLAMVAKRWKSRRGKVAWLQALSGLYLAIFLLNHVGAVLVGRSLLKLDTDFRFAAAGFHVSPWHLVFGPYYFLAVFFLAAHIGCALYWHIEPSRPRLRNCGLATCLGFGGALGLLVILSLAGALSEVTIPPPYLATYGG